MDPGGLQGGARGQRRDGDEILVIFGKGDGSGRAMGSQSSNVALCTY